ncbi:HD domain-containing protein [Mariprofundus sp. EBB-1]|uniref:HD-GYP domain-containing protein n=1 Tax=Mariprofundus sp. EBB-1 TaxID=2650971 RepID=UPI000EF204A2|nr:HD domain-containing phosphohydrolase [Mariprofundus sp. EBB-1]RLL53319.1 HD domain-containing protein [Mariprofundus sp. EBB-1]
MRRVIHYAASMMIVPIYGVQVCPFIEGLSVFWVVAPIIMLFLIQYALGAQLWNRWLSSKALEDQVRSAFNLEMALFMATGVLLTVFNSMMFDFPLGSGLKMIVGITGLGFFAAVDLALEAERSVAKQVIEQDIVIDPFLNYFPLTSKMAIFASASLLLVIGVFMLLVIKDLDWLVKVGDSITLVEGRIDILKEFLFVLAVILPHTLNVVFSYSRNIHAAFDAQNRLLTQASMGDYSGSIAISSADEFGVMAKHTNYVVKVIRDRTEELRCTRDVSILALTTLAEARDNETGAHILRTQRYVRALAIELKNQQKFADYLDDETIDLLYKSAPLHDVGKVGIPDAILLKNGKLTQEEFEIMKTHPQIGADALSIAEEDLGTNSFLTFAREISLTHHEKWDGSGYPAGLSGDAIPCSGRLMAVADVYDALISKRVYKPGFSHEKAKAVILEGRGTHFDPDIVDAFIAAEEAFCVIAKQYEDSPTQ